MKVFYNFLLLILITQQIFQQLGATTIKFQAPDVDPCEDFYEYACGDYSYENSYPLYNEITQKLDYDLNVKLLRHFESLWSRNNKPDDQSYLEKMLLYYKSCKSETRRNIRKYLDEVKPSNDINWPLMEPKEKTWPPLNRQFSLWFLLGELQSYGLNNVIITQEMFRNKDNTLNIWLTPTLTSDQGSLPETEVIRVLLKAMGLENEEIILKELKETDLKWQNLLRQFEAYSGEEEIFLFKNLTETYEPLKSYLENLLGNQELENISFISVENPQYFKYVFERQWSYKELEQLTNYLMIKFLYFLAVDSTAEYSALECIKDLRNKFDLAANYISYYHLYRYNTHKYQANYTIITNLKNSMLKYFKENNLNLNAQQIHYMTNKLKNIKINIGNLPSNHDYKTIDNFYQDIENLDAKNYYKNHLILLKHLFRKSLQNQQNQTFYLVTTKDMAGMSSPFYIPQLNMIIIPIGSFQTPLFHYRANEALQQVSLFGFVLSHEMGHAFDTTGLEYDLNGYPLTSPSSIKNQKNFIKALNCMQEQEPTDELDERIADFMGVRIAFRTFADYYARGLNWQKDFFKHMAQFFCGKDGLDFIDHDADPIRLRQIVKNFPEFAKAFGCREESPMNPRNKCNLY